MDCFNLSEHLVDYSVSNTSQDKFRFVVVVVGCFVRNSSQLCTCNLQFQQDGI